MARYTVSKSVQSENLFVLNNNRELRVFESYNPFFFFFFLRKTVLPGKQFANQSHMVIRPNGTRQRIIINAITRNDSISG